MDIRQATNEFYLQLFKGKWMSFEARNYLDIDKNGGNYFLPKKVSDRIVLDYPETNKLRPIITVTAIKNLEQPILTYSASDGVSLKGDSIAFSNKRDRIDVSVSETILFGTNSNLYKAIEQVLQSELYKRERNRIFSMTPATGEEHMSMYHNDILEITGANVYEGIQTALLDLPQAVRDNASVLVNPNDYNTIVKHLGTVGLGALGARPELIFNRNLLIIDQVTKPIIGDFSCVQANYEELRLDKDKAIKTGVISIVLSVIYDIRITIPGAFRIVDVPN